jgi:hypothetical protein
VLYAAILLCSLYKFVRCGPLAIVACRLVMQGIYFKEADLSVAPTKFMQLHGLLYGSERSTLSKHLKSRIEATEMSFLRTVVAYRRIYNIRNLLIWRQIRVFITMDKLIRTIGSIDWK